MQSLTNSLSPEQLDLIAERTVHTRHAVQALHDYLPPEHRTVEKISMICEYASAKAVSIYAIVEIMVVAAAKPSAKVQQNVSHSFRTKMGGVYVTLTVQ